MGQPQKASTRAKEPMSFVDEDDDLLEHPFRKEMNEESMDVSGLGVLETEVDLNSAKGNEVVVQEAEQTNRAETTDFEDEEDNPNDITRTKRGIASGVGARRIMKITNQRLPLEFDFKSKRVISDSDSAFMHECGYIVRKHCSLKFKDWRRMPNDVRLPLRHKLTTLFDIDVENPDICKVIDSYMARAWRLYRGKLHSYFKEIEGSTNLTKTKASPPTDVNKDDREFLCDRWTDPDYLEMTKKRVKACQNRKTVGRNGSKSTIRYHLELGHDLESSTGQIETWGRTHLDAKTGQTSTDVAAKYDDLIKLRNEHSVESMSDKSILEKVLGRSSVRLHGWGRDPTIASSNTNSDSDRPCYNAVVEELNSVKKTCNMMLEVMIANNLIPPSATTEALQQNQDDTLELEDELDENAHDH